MPSLRFNPITRKLDLVASNITDIATRSHADLQNLGADDHTQYLLIDGSRAMTGPLTLTGTARVEKLYWIGANGIKAPGAKPATFVEDGLTGCWEFDDAIA